MKKLEDWIIPLGIGFYILLSFLHVGDWFINDEAAFTVSAYPVSLQPPLYQGILNLLGMIFGNAEWVYRGFGMLTNIGAAFFIFKLSEFFQPKSGRISVLAYLFLPVIVQGGLIPDIDFTILNLFLIGTVYIYFVTRASHLRFLYYFVLFLILLWSKNTTTYALAFGLPIVDYLRTKNKSDILYFAITLLMSYVFFVLTLFLCSQITHINFYGEVLGHNTVSILSLFQQFIIPKYYVEMIYYSVSVLLWSSPFLWCILLIPFFSKTYFKDISLNVKSFMFLTVLISLPYLFIKITAAGFPKYVYPMFAFLSVILGIILARNTYSKDDNRVGYTIVFDVFFLALMMFFFLGDPLKTPFVPRLSGLYSSALGSSSIVNIVLFYGSKFLVLTLLGGGYVWLKKYTNKTSLLLSLFVLMLAYNISLNAHQAFADYNTRYSYGEKGFKESILFLRHENARWTEVIGRPEVQYYMSDKTMSYLSSIEVIPSDTTPINLKKRLVPLEIFDRVGNSFGIVEPKYFLLSNYDIMANSQWLAIYDELQNYGFDQEMHFDDYTIFYKKNR